MKAVIWTDVLQAIVIFAAIIQGFIVVGGVKWTLLIAYWIWLILIRQDEFSHKCDYESVFFLFKF